MEKELRAPVVGGDRRVELALLEERGWTTCGIDHAVDLRLDCLHVECELSNNGHELLTPLTSMRWSTRTKGLRMGDMWVVGEGMGWTVELEHKKGPQWPDRFQPVKLREGHRGMEGQCAVPHVVQDTNTQTGKTALRRIPMIDPQPHTPNRLTFEAQDTVTNVVEPTIIDHNSHH